MPRPLSPADGVRVPYLVTFRWTEVPGAAGYIIQVAGDEGFAAPLLVDDTVVNPEFEVGLPVSGPLWWRVRALGEAGAPGPWSAVRRFGIVPPPLAVSVAGISLNPSSVAGGTPSEGLVTLADPAPEQGATVFLSSSNSGRAAVPSLVMFAAGEIAAPFPIATMRVTSETEVRISAAAREERRLATLTIVPYRGSARISAFAVQPAILAAGSGAQGTVTLASPAPSPTMVRLSTSDVARALVPEAVLIPAGALAAQFPVETAHDTASGTIFITASVDGETRTASLNLRGAAGMGPLPAPSPIAPQVGATVIHDGVIEFAWSDVMGAVSYTIEVDHSGGFGGALAASRTVPASRLAISPLAPGTVWWRVRANDSNGAPGRWSPARPLRVK